MPIGLVLMMWDIKVSTEILAKYPDELVISEETLMQIYAAHEYTGEPGMISLLVGPLNIASYYTGRDKPLYIILLLNLDEDADSFEATLKNICASTMTNDLSDLSPLSDLINLEFIDLSNNQISDLSPLSDLINLERLDISLNNLNEDDCLVINQLSDRGVKIDHDLSCEQNEPQ